VLRGQTERRKVLRVSQPSQDSGSLASRFWRWITSLKKRGNFTRYLNKKFNLNLQSTNKKQRTTVPVRKMIPVVLRNHFVGLAVCPLLTVKLFDWANIEPRAPEDETFVNIFISCVLCGLAFEVTFFFGHYFGEFLSFLKKGTLGFTQRVNDQL
jgi:hypothetical protein